MAASARSSRILSDRAVAFELTARPAWRRDGAAIVRDYTFTSFEAAFFSFMTRAAREAASLDHHPQWSNGYRVVSVRLTTHDAGGITDLDFELARRLDRLAVRVAANGRAAKRVRGAVVDARCRALGILGVAEALALGGEIVKADRRSRIVRIETTDGAVFVKTFRYGGALRRLFRTGVRSHCRREAESLEVLRLLGVPAPQVLAWGERRLFGAPRAAFVVTAEVPEAASLFERLRRGAFDVTQRRRLLQTLAGHVACLHDAGFVDGDLKFRNILVDEQGRLHHVDSPKGRLWRAPLAAKRAAVDLGLLGKHAPLVATPCEVARFLVVYGRLRRLPRAVLRETVRRAERRAELLHRREKATR